MRLPSLAIVCGAVALSLALTAVIGYVTARSENTRVMMTVGAELRSTANVPPDRADAFWKSLERGRFLMSWVYSPVVAVTVGAFVGILARTRPVALAAFGITPYAGVFAFARNSVAERLAFFLLYLAVAAAIAYVSSALRNRLARSEQAAQQ